MKYPNIKYVFRTFLTKICKVILKIVGADFFHSCVRREISN